MRPVTKFQAHHYGAYAAVAYAMIVVGVFAYTAYATKPDYLGYDWIPFILLTRPWSAICAPVLGLILNAALLFILGTLLERLRR